MKIGISLASLLPWSAFWPLAMTNIAKNIGYEFVQALPMRKVDKDYLDHTSLPILYYEEAWHPGSLAEMACGKIGLMDWIFFPDKERARTISSLFEEKGIISIGHDFDDLYRTDLIEPGPGMQKNIDEILAALHVYGQKQVVLDLFHIREIGSWNSSINKLAPYTQLIHFQPLRQSDELERFLRSENTEVENMLRAMLSYGFDNNIVVEATVGIKGINLFHLKRTMKMVLNRLKSITRGDKKAQ